MMKARELKKLSISKQKLAVLSNQIRRYRESQQWRQQNTQNTTIIKETYRKIEQNDNIQDPEVSGQRGAKQYWKEICQNPVSHNKKNLV